ncbi:MAG: selenium metabolism-associated LysR family transcriptional regulator [Bacillota bacterium]|jgi:DNA-binding transcriptional LysR family regulator|nr:selenium metabolism-associated LysR family transcriptional regulator [Bacillota bacterium]NLL59548.1 LysR family transcriptional regulator [Tissierellia bacterium]
MEFNQLESFIKVVKFKSFSLAAKELYTTQPTVSNNIKNLEKELNTTLLDRNSKTISLTDSGKLFYKYAVELVNIRDKAKFAIADHDCKVEGVIEICASSIPEEYILPYVIKDFSKKYPKVLFSVTHKDSRKVIDSILEGKLNYGIVGAKYYSEVLEYIDFYEDEIVLCLPEGERNPWSDKDLLDIKTLFSEKFIFRKPGSGTRRLIEERLSEKGIDLDDLNIISYIDSNEMIKKMVELGLGISFMSKIAVKNECDLKLIKTLRIKDLDLRRNFYFVYNKNRTLPPLVEAFKDFLISWKY